MFEIGDTVRVHNVTLVSHGQRGVILAQEGKCYKVQLDQPVNCGGAKVRIFKFHRKNLRKVEIEIMPVHYTEIKVTKEEEQRKLVAFVLDNGIEFLSLTESQIKLLQWLADNDYFYDYVTIQEIDPKNITTV